MSKYVLSKYVDGRWYNLQSVIRDENGGPHVVFCNNVPDAWLFDRACTARDLAKYLCRNGDKLKICKVTIRD